MYFPLCKCLRAGNGLLIYAARPPGAAPKDRSRAEFHMNRGLTMERLIGS